MDNMYGSDKNQAAEKLLSGDIYFRSWKWQFNLLAILFVFTALIVLFWPLIAYCFSCKLNESVYFWTCF